MNFTVDEVEQLENGSLIFEKQVDLIQRLIDSGMLWRLNNNIYQHANYLIERGYVYDR